MADVFDYHRGHSPLLISFPHDGQAVPAELKPGFNSIGNSNLDGDWFISTAYDFIHDLDISFIRALNSRYVVDLNRSRQGELLYPGKWESGLCPLTTFDGEALYVAGREPANDEIERRVATWWDPYHEHIRGELARIRRLHGYAILWDAHSIRGEVPRLFAGCLPDLNFGTADNSSCAGKWIDVLVNTARESSDYSVTLNERFKGGYITRHYGDPSNDIHAIQLEINQHTYLEKTRPPKVDREKSQRLSQQLQQLVRLLL